MSTRSSFDSTSQASYPSRPDDTHNGSPGHSGSAPSRISSHRLLYTSHFLSTWNSRAFEFGAFLFLASIYPQTLLPASIYALARAGSVALFSPWLGSYIDETERLKAVRASIIGQRIAVALSCGLLYALVTVDAARRHALASYGALAVLSVLACVEKLAAVINTISIERDWIVILAGNDEGTLRTMNSQMRRIDLFCKLVAPLFISLIDGLSSRTAILVTGGMTATSVLVEYSTIARVYSSHPELRIPKSSDRHADLRPSGVRFNLTNAITSTTAYITHPAFLPSFALALLYLTVLSFNGQLITYLLALDLSSPLIGLLRGTAALFELSATWLAPHLISRIGAVRAGIWFLNWQLACVSLATLFLWLSPTALTLTTASAIAAVIASRVGLWGFDLSAQLIVQEEVAAGQRGAFSAREVAAQNLFETLSFASTAVWAAPGQFRIPATMSAGAVGVASVLYAAFVRRRRGHLVHYSRCMERDGKMASRGWRRVAGDIEEDAGAVELREADRW